MQKFWERGRGREGKERDQYATEEEPKEEEIYVEIIFIIVEQSFRFRFVSSSIVQVSRPMKGD